MAGSPSESSVISDVPNEDEILPEKYSDDVEGLDDDGLEDRNEDLPFRFWESKQRDLVTSVVDYNLSTLASLVNAKTIDVSPNYQRRMRWDARRQSSLIESFFMNVPVPSIYLNEDSYGQYSVIDGKQRLLAITNFLDGHLKLTGLNVFEDLNGKTYNDLNPEFRAVIDTRPTLRATIVLRQSDPDIKFLVFQRLNTGGIKLNAQEIRNSAFTGPLNDLILRLSTDSDFHRLLGVKDVRRSAIYQEMRDAEFVLRFFTFRDDWSAISSGMRRAMDDFMSQNQRPSRKMIASLEREFRDALVRVEACFGDFSFRRWVPDADVWRNQVLASLFDAEMFGSMNVNPEFASDHQEEIVTMFKGLFLDPEFRTAIDAATNTASYFRTRISKVREMLEYIGMVNA